MPIKLAPINVELKIVRVLCDTTVKKHLVDMGVGIGECITVLSSSGGSVVCRVKGGKIALDKDLSAKILVA